MHFEIDESKDGQYFLRLVGANNEIIMVSETYKAKQSATTIAKRINEEMGNKIFKVEDKTVDKRTREFRESLGEGTEPFDDDKSTCG